MGCGNDIDCNSKNVWKVSPRKKWCRPPYMEWERETVDCLVTSLFAQDLICTSKCEIKIFVELS